METGRGITFRVELERENYDEPIQLIIDQPSPSGTIMEAVVPRGENSVEVTLPRDSTATLGKKRRSSSGRPMKHWKDELSWI